MRKAKVAGNPKLAIGYTRVSTEEQHNGPEAQRAAIEAWAAAKGITIVEWREESVSGGAQLDKRLALIEAINLLQETGAGLLVAAKRDRIARDAVLAVSIERMVEGEGAKLVTADGVTADSTPEGRLVRGILDLFAEYERAMIKARTKAALAAKQRRGESTGNVSYGKRIVGGTPGPNGGTLGGTVEVDEVEGAVVARIIQLRESGGSLREICRILEEDGVPSRGKGWHPSTVRSILANFA